jgi:type I restriction enzyme, S subunit
MKSNVAQTWKKEKLGDLVSFKTGRLDSNAATENGAYPFFTCAQQTLQTDTYSFDGEFVLLAGNNANGVYPIKYYRGKFDAYQRTYVIRSLDEGVLDNRFLYYALRPKLEMLKSLSTGVATKFLTLSILREVEILVPPLEVQQQITRVLSAYDDLMENNAQRVAILEEMARSLYREWFVDFRFPGHDQAAMENGELGLLPHGWNVVSIGNRFTTVLGGTPNRKRLEYWQDGTIPWINSGKVNDLRVIDHSELITPLGLNRSSTKMMPKGTTVIAITGATLGQVSRLEIEACAN